MYQSIGINLSKDLDLATKRIKVPAITQRPYYKNANKYEEEYINLCEADCDNDLDYNENFDYLDDDSEDSYDSCDCCESNCIMDKLKCIDPKIAIMSGIGALIGIIAIYKLLKRK